MHHESKRNPTRREPEHCDTCGETVGFYDPTTMPEGEKIILTRDCECVKQDNKIRGRK
jgi:hypothetical protein